MVKLIGPRSPKIKLGLHQVVAKQSSIDGIDELRDREFQKHLRPREATTRSIETPPRVRLLEIKGGETDTSQM